VATAFPAVPPETVVETVAGWKTRERSRAAAIYWKAGVPIGRAARLFRTTAPRVSRHADFGEEVWTHFPEPDLQKEIVRFISDKRGATYNEICRHLDVDLSRLHELMGPLITRLDRTVPAVMPFPLVMCRRAKFFDPGTPPNKYREEPGVEDEKMEEAGIAEALRPEFPFCSTFYLLGESPDNVERAVARVEHRRMFRRGGPLEARGRLTKGDFFEDLVWSALRPLAVRYRFAMRRRPRCGKGDLDIYLPSLRTVVMTSFHSNPNRWMPSHSIEIARRLGVMERYGFHRPELLLCVGTYVSPGFPDQLGSSLELRGLEDVRYSIYEFECWTAEDLEAKLPDLESWFDGELRPQRFRHPYVIEELEMELEEIKARLRVGPPFGPDPIERMALLKRMAEIRLELMRLRRRR